MIIHLKLVLRSFNSGKRLMLTRFFALASATVIFFLSLQPSWADNDLLTKGSENLNNIDLPTVIDEDMFDDLPFEQRRQALRDEVELGPQSQKRHSNQRKYNLLIR